MSHDLSGLRRLVARSTLASGRDADDALAQHGMPIPDFQTLMRPLLEHLAAGRERPNRETLEAMARRFNVTDEERARLLPSGKQPVFVNRVAWAKSHLKGAGAIRSR